MTVRFKDDFFYDVRRAYISVVFNSNCPLDLSGVTYALELVCEYSCGYFHRYSGFMTHDLSKAASVLEDLNISLESGAQEWEVPE